MAREQLNVRLPEAVIEAMDEYAGRWGTTRTSVVEEAVRLYVGMTDGAEPLPQRVDEIDERLRRVEEVAERAG